MKLYKIIVNQILQILGETYKTKQEKGQYKSVFELTICKKI